MFSKHLLIFAVCALTAAAIVLSSSGVEAKISIFSDRRHHRHSPSSSLRSSSAAYSVNTQTNQIIDADGRERFFHGANVVVKGFPFLPETSHWNPNTSFVAKDMQGMQSLGLNAIRLGAMWPGVMPTSPSAINETYLAEMKKIVLEASDYGIHTLLDMHQDVISQRYCGEGFPVWLNLTNNVTNFPWPFEKTPYKTNDQGVPSYTDCHKHAWGEYYFSEAASTAWQNFYDNAFGIQTIWTQAWSAIASTFADVGAPVIAHELLNEPWVGNPYKDPKLMLPGAADKKNLQAAWNNGAAAIREKDSSHIVFFEGVTFDWLGVGFTQVPGGSSFANKSAIAFHFYKPPDIDMPLQFAALQKDRKRLNCAMFLTEFGVSACPGCLTESPALLMDECDKTLTSGWLFWELKPFAGYRTGHGWSLWNPDGSWNDTVAKLVSRTYAQAVAGETQKMFFNRVNANFVLQYTTKSAVTAANSLTEIYFNQKYHYPNGVDVSATLTVGKTTTPVKFSIVGGQFVHVETPSGVPDGSTVNVELNPK